MGQELYAIANSAPLWILGAILIIFVLIQNTLYLRLAKKEADVIQYPAEKLKQSMKVGAITAIGPALANIVAMVSMMAALGSPVGWMRLSVIGTATTELGVATIVSLSSGLTGFTDPNMTVSIFALILLMMAVVCSGWLLVVIIATPAMGSIRAKIIEKDKTWASVLSTATMVGLFSNLAALQLKTPNAAMYSSVAAAFIVMFLIQTVAAKKNPKIKMYALAISLIAGLLVGGVISVL